MHGKSSRQDFFTTGSQSSVYKDLAGQDVGALPSHIPLQDGSLLPAWLSLWVPEPDHLCSNL